MATRVIDDSKLNAIAVAIQTKDNGGQMTVDEMPDRVEAIPGFIGLIDNTISGEVVIPEGITTIPDNKFNNCNLITKLTLPSTLTTIGASAFRYCTGITYLSIPYNIQTVNTFGLQNLTSLESLNVKNLENWVLSTQYANSAFSGSSNWTLYVNDIPMKNIDLSGLSITAITSIFPGCDMENFIMPNTIEIITASAFRSCSSLKKITIPSSVKTINISAFQACTSLYFIDLTSFTDPQAIPTLANANAFSGIPSTAQFIVKNQEMYDAFTTTTNWSTYASEFVIEGA